MNGKSLISQDPELETALLQRGENISEVGLRDLKRYYALLNHDLLELALTPDETRLICEVLKDYRFEDDPEQARMIWQQIDKKLQSQHLDPQWSVNGFNIAYCCFLRYTALQICPKSNKQARLSLCFYYPLS